MTPQPNKRGRKEELEPLSEHGKVVREFPVQYARHCEPPNEGHEAPQPLETLNLLWHGRENSIQRVPYITGDKQPIVKWKTERRRMEWETQEVGEDQASRRCHNRIKYKSSRISTEGKMSRGACVVVDNKVCVSLMDEMYKMTPFNGHPSAEITKATAVGNGSGEERGRLGYADPSAGASRGDLTSGGTNQPITVQVKKHETEQQTEARMRSYAYFVQTDEQDPWKYARIMSGGWCNRERKVIEASWRNSSDMVTVPQNRPSMRICKDPREVFLDHVLANGNPEKRRKLIASGEHAATIQAAIQVKREAAVASHVGKPHAPSATPDHDSLDQLRNIMEQTFTTHAVVSRERVFSILKATHHSSRLRAMAAAYHEARSNGDEEKRAQIDEQLHRWLMESCRQFIRHIKLRHDGMERYIRFLEGRTVNDQTKLTILDVIQRVDRRDASNRDGPCVVRKQDILTACDERKIRLSDTVYSRIMKEYCVSVKGGWSLKTGNEDTD